MSWSWIPHVLPVPCAECHCTTSMVLGNGVFLHYNGEGPRPYFVTYPVVYGGRELTKFFNRREAEKYAREKRWLSDQMSTKVSS